MASGYPSGCTSMEDKLRYIETVKNQEGIEIDPKKIEYNPGIRTVSK